jgi:hypothetical protein
MRESKFPLLNDKEWLHQKYEIEKLTAKQISSIVGSSKWTVFNQLNKFGIATSPKSRKYPLLDDDNWLRQKYEVDKLSTEQIGELVGGANAGQVVTHLHRLQINTPRLCKKYPLLNDAQWLKSKYEDEKFSINAIAALVGNAEPGHVYQRLCRCGVKIRTKSEGHVFSREDDGFVLNEMTKSVIVGALLGDGSLSSSNKKSDGSCPSFRKTNIYYDHVSWVAQLLFGDKWKSRVTERWTKGLGFGNGQPRRIFCIQGLTRKELMYYFRKWYPPENNYKKVVPKDIEINKTVLLHWFLDDGYSYKVVKKWKTKAGIHTREMIRVQFATEGFQKEELEMLCDKIKNQLGLIMYPRFHQRHGKIDGTGYHLELSQKQISQFFKIIGPPPIKSLAYKWKYI